MNSVFLYISIFSILIIYIFFIINLYFHWNNIEITAIIKPSKKLPFVSIIIVGRNEAANIKACINSILQNEYPKSKYEIIYIDDDSNDDSIKKLKSIKAKNFIFYKLSEIINIENHINHKKESIKQAVNLAKGEIILQTDADTVVGKKWILSHVTKYSCTSDLQLVTAPVLFFEGGNLLEQFQYYDLLSTIGITGAGIKSKMFFMANGANMSYRKSLYQSLELDNNYASGDDIFLINSAAKKDKNSISFLKNTESIVYTYPEKTIRDFFNQRIRWATKTKSYLGSPLSTMILLVFLTNILLILNIFAQFITVDYSTTFSLIFILLKLFVDSFFILRISKFFNKKVNCCYLILSLFLYPFYLSAISISSLVIKKYNWKGRKVK